MADPLRTAIILVMADPLNGNWRLRYTFAAALRVLLAPAPFSQHCPIACAFSISASTAPTARQ
jgi:hypothetical protein